MRSLVSIKVPFPIDSVEVIVTRKPKSPELHDYSWAHFEKPDRSVGRLLLLAKAGFVRVGCRTA